MDAYLYLQGTNRKFTGCKGGTAASYHGKPQMKFTTSAKYYALGFRDAGLVSALNIKCGNAIVTKAEHKFRDSDNKCQACPKGFGCNGRVACPKNAYATLDGQCKACPAGNTCDGVGKQECKPSIGVESVMAWNTGQKNHDVDLTKSWSQFTTSGKVLRDKKSSTSLSVVSNYFWFEFFFLTR